MIVTQHRLTFTAICPVNGSRDVYQMTVETSETIEVERILAAVEQATKEPVYQESLTQWLADGLGATVTTEAVHSGVETRCKAERAVTARPVF